MVGAPYHDSLSVTNSGAAYVFTRNSNSADWDQTQKLVQRNAVAGDKFGFDIKMAGDRAIIGGANDLSSFACLFEKIATGEWNETQRFSGTDGTNFGYHVAISDQYVAMGAKGDDTYGLNAGNAFVYSYACFWALQT